MTAALTPEQAVVVEAERRYLNDPEFHATVDTAVAVLVYMHEPKPTKNEGIVAVKAAAIALVLAEGPKVVG